MSALAGNWRCCVSCSTLWFLLLSSASAFRNELLSVSPFHKKSTAQSKLIFFFYFFSTGSFFICFFMMLQQHFLRLKPADCPV